MAVLEVKNLTKRFGDLEVLKGVSFSLEKGQVLAIIGSSGGGKSTLLRCLNFLETPDSGEIIVDGKQLLSGSEEEIRKNRLHFGLVFQNFNLFPQYSVLENVTLAPTLLKEFAAKHELAKDHLHLIQTPYMDEEVRIALNTEASALGFRKVTWVRTGCVITCHGGPGAFGIVGVSGKD